MEVGGKNKKRKIRNCSPGNAYMISPGPDTRPSKPNSAPHEHIIALLPFLTSCLSACELQTRRMTTEPLQANRALPHGPFPVHVLS